jgi:hypothetical protein
MPFARIIFKDGSTLVFYGMPFKYKTAKDPEEAPF